MSEKKSPWTIIDYINACPTSKDCKHADLLKVTDESYFISVGTVIQHDNGFTRKVIINMKDFLTVLDYYQKVEGLKPNQFPKQIAFMLNEPPSTPVETEADEGGFTVVE
jgi:hypothetical protein